MPASLAALSFDLPAFLDTRLGALCVLVYMLVLMAAVAFIKARCERRSLEEWKKSDAYYNIRSIRHQAETCPEAPLGPNPRTQAWRMMINGLRLSDTEAVLKMDELSRMLEDELAAVTADRDETRRLLGKAVLAFDQFRYVAMLADNVPAAELNDMDAIITELYAHLKSCNTD